MKQSQEVIGELIETFAELPHILDPMERRPYFDAVEAQTVADMLSSKDRVIREVNLRKLSLKELHNRMPHAFHNPTGLSGFPGDGIRAFSFTQLFPTADGDTPDVNVLRTRDFYWIDRVA